MDEALRRSSAHVFVDNVDAPVLSDADQHHLSRVLRLRAGESVSCSDGRGSWRMCEWVGDVIRATGSANFVDRPSATLGVALAPVKGDRTEDAVEKLVEIGIDRIVILAPVEHSVVRWDGDRAVTSMQRIERVVRAAAMQSRRVWLPVREGPTPLSHVLAEPGVAMAEPGGTADLTSLTTVVVGPEGGFSPEEVALAQSTVDLGASILRAGTAAVVAGALMVAHSRR